MLQETPRRSIHIKTFGCQMNVYDSDRMTSALVKHGMRYEADLTKADVILLNTCSIRAKSEQKVLSLLGQLKPLKEQNPKKVLGVTGCIGQRMGRSLLQRVPHLDLVLGPDGIDRVADLVDSVINNGKRLVDATLDVGT
jgi:tRNA-2-methylthio-N6-dimethylallyladenosine synthase